MTAIDILLDYTQPDSGNDQQVLFYRAVYQSAHTVAYGYLRPDQTTVAKWLYTYLEDKMPSSEFFDQYLGEPSPANDEWLRGMDNRIVWSINMGRELSLHDFVVTQLMRYAICSMITTSRKA